MIATHRRAAGALTVLILASAGAARAQSAAEKLSIGAASGSVAVVEAALREGAPVDGRDSDGDTALMQCLNADVARVLLRAGASPNTSNPDGWTPLLFASVRGDARLVAVLLKAGADPKAASKDGKTALALARQTGSKPVAALLENAGATAPASAAAAPSPAFLRSLARIPADDRLFDAVARGDLAGVRAALKAGARADDRNADGSGILASALNHPAGLPPGPKNLPAIVRALLRAGADANARANDGWTPLMYAANSGETECAALLLKAGARANDRTKNGQTALMRAAAYGSLGCVRLLLKAGADKRLRDADGKTAAHYTRETSLTALLGD